MKIAKDDPLRADVRQLLTEHLEDMARHSPPESTHALDSRALAAPDVTFWSAREAGALMGCAALKALGEDLGEIKSMRTHETFRRRGVAARLLAHVIDVARSRGYRALFLETGSMAAFEPARQLYAANGFSYCAPFADYVEDPNSVFMRRELG